MGSFGSIGLPEIYLTQWVVSQRPQLTCTLMYNGQQIQLTGILDTGTDVTVMSISQQPETWTLITTHAVLARVVVGRPCQSKEFITETGPEQRAVTSKPYVLKSPITLWE